MSRNTEVAAKLAARIKQQVERGMGKGLEAGLVFLAARCRETMSVPAPRKKVGDGYRATTRAIKGAPIRKLSGRARASVTTRMMTPNHGILSVKARSVKGFNYPSYHERRMGGGSGLHPFIAPTVMKYKQELKKIIGTGIKGGFK